MTILGVKETERRLPILDFFGVGFGFGLENPSAHFVSGWIGIGCDEVSTIASAGLDDYSKQDGRGGV